MKISKKTNAPIEFVFKKIVESSQHDIRLSTGKNISLAQLKGFEYKKQFNKYQAGKIKILNVVENEEYTFETNTTKNGFTTSYLLEKVGDKETRVTVEEKMVSHGFFQNANDLFTSFALGWLKKRQIKTMIEAIGKQYQA
jgi:hypothetical protein